MKKIKLGILIGAVILLSLLAMFATKDSVVKLGVVGDYSSKASMASVAAYRAIELAVEQINGKSIQYEIVRFNIGTYTNMVSFKKDIMRNDIDIIVGPSTSSQFYLTKEVLESVDLPVFLLSVSADEIFDKEDNLFRMTDTIEIQVESLLSACETYLGIDEIQIYYSSENIGFSKPFAEDLSRTIHSSGGQAETFEVGNLSDDAVQNLLLDHKDAKGFVVIAGPGQAGIIADILSKNNPDASIFFPEWSKSERTIEYTINIKNDMYIMSSLEPIRPERYKAFDEAFRDKKNMGVTAFSYFGYEVVYFLDFVLNEINSVELSDIQDYIHSMDSYKGNFNDFTFNNTGDGGRGYTVMSIKDGKFIVGE